MAEKTLVMSFLNESGKKATISVSGVKDEATEAQISQAMDVIIAKNIFHTLGGDLKMRDGAQVVSRSVEKLTIK